MRGIKEAPVLPGMKRFWYRSSSQTSLIKLFTLRDFLRTDTMKIASLFVRVVLFLISAGPLAAAQNNSNALSVGIVRHVLDGTSTLKPTDHGSGLVSRIPTIGCHRASRYHPDSKSFMRLDIPC